MIPETPPEFMAEPIPEPERYPFWSYGDVMVFAGLAIPAGLIGFMVVKAAFWILRLHPAIATWELLLNQFAAYLLLFLSLYGIFHVQYRRPFWESLAWTKPPLAIRWIVLAGAATVFAVALLGVAIHVPNVKNTIVELMKDRTSIVLMIIFGVALAPLCEELIFRGFLQPLLVRSLGTVPGILAAALPFGLLHFKQYGDSWKHVLLISIAGAAFGWMRHATGSTKAATIMHGAYNGLQFMAYLVATKLPVK